MRKIKFKAIRKDNGRWAYGDLVHYYSIKMGKRTDYVAIGVDLDLDDVIPETVCQFTGLKDKNGVEIYDGDVLKIDEGHPVEVRYEKIYASFGIWRKGWAFLHYFHEAVEPEDCEVIGNIHDKNKQQ